MALARFISRVRSALGPGIVFLLGAVGPRDLVSNSIAGASMGASLMWVLAVAAIGRAAILEASARYVLVTGHSLLDGIGRYSRTSVMLWFGSSMLHRFISSMLKVSLLGAAAHFVLPLPTKWSREIWAAGSCAAGFVLVYWGRYRAVERLAKPIAAVMGCCLLLAAVAARPDPAVLLNEAMHPAFPPAEGDFPPALVVMAVLAAAMGSLSNVKYAAYVHETGWRTPDFLRRQRFDLAVSMSSMFVMMALVQIAAAGALRPRGLSVTQIEHLVPIFTQALGSAGQLLFGVTLWCVVFSGMVGNGMGYAVMLADVYHRHIRPSSEGVAAASELPAYRPMVLYLFLTPLVVLVTGWTPVTLVLADGLFGVLTIPLVAFLVLRLTADGGRMGKYRNGWLSNAVLVMTVALAFLLSYLLAVELLAR
ncbi:MAG: Nramp family divalent metal transporter [Bryobacter sp.]|nr:Nramp family divalent metal transporter [Bryobacter sp.]